MPVTVRSMGRGDVAVALELMRELAEFEDYLDEFAVGENDLLEAGFGPNRRFKCHLAFERDRAVGIAVTHTIEWTFDMQPTLVLKEMFVRESHRGTGAGRLLFDFVVREAEKIGASRIRWLVLGDNENAERFYRSRGAEVLPQWEQWELRLPDG